MDSFVHPESLFYAVDEIGQLVSEEVQGRGYPRQPGRERANGASDQGTGYSAAGSLSKIVWENWIREEPGPLDVSDDKVQPGRARRLFWHTGTLLVRGGRWLQKRYPVAASQAEA